MPAACASVCAQRSEHGTCHGRLRDMHEVYISRISMCVGEGTCFILEPTHCKRLS